MTNISHKVLYTGITNNLERRVYEHKNKTSPTSFTSKYNCNILVFYESTSNIESALDREKQIKAGNRSAKIAGIEKMNPTWRDLSLEF